ncbi:YncE family protein [Streptomyces sp. NPDC092369]|uniref:YncE family protein n=1 Tax=Streptomyces sp. NPDC092369 TaxID=3366015 RepID=UPI003814FEB9
MNVDEVLRATLREQAAEQASAGPGLADRVVALQHRRRARRFATVAAVTAAVVAVAVAVPLLDSGGGDDIRPGGVLRPDEIKARPDQSPPRDQISAGNTVLAAYATSKFVERTATSGSTVRTYWLLDQRTGRYVKAPKWSFVAVDPGMRSAAVLERGLPASRIGLLDLSTGKVERWIPVDHGVGALAYSPDGRRLVATTYAGDPDQLVVEGHVWERKAQSDRTGFYVLDVASGKGSWSEVAPPRVDSLFDAEEHFAFSNDGTRVWIGVAQGDGEEQYFDLSGTEVPEPRNERYRKWSIPAGLSPSGRFAATDFPGKKWKYSSWVVDTRTGERTEVQGQQLLAWVGDKQLIAWGAPDGAVPPGQPLVLLTVGSDKVVPLSGPRPTVVEDDSVWTPVFAQRGPH